ncbi:MAG: hypothetical protein HC836_40015 [Richelia sp. RM2_1_2]|nr:hypothetical protein [Richelia sp. RM2_1_2]
MRYSELYDDQIIRLNFEQHTYYIMEDYKDPVNELHIKFNERSRNTNLDGTEYVLMEAIVFEKTTNDEVIRIDYTIGRNHPVHIMNIRATKVDANKIMHTMQYSTGGFSADVGARALRWIYKQIQNDAAGRGYTVKGIISKSRDTGIRGLTAQMTGVITRDVHLKSDYKFFVFDGERLFESGDEKDKF